MQQSHLALESFQPEAKKEQESSTLQAVSAVEHEDHRTLTHAQSIQAAMIQGNIRALMQFNHKIDAFKKLAFGDLHLEKEIQSLEELNRFAACPSHEDFRGLSFYFMYLIAARHTWNNWDDKHGFWSTTSKLGLINIFDKNFKANPELLGLSQAVQEAIRVQEKIVFLGVFKKVNANTVDILDQRYDAKQIGRLDPETYQENQTRALQVLQNCAKMATENGGYKFDLLTSKEKQMIQETAVNGMVRQLKYLTRLLDK